MTIPVGREARATQSVAMSPDEQTVIRMAATKAGLSVAAWGFARIMSALSSATAQAGSKKDIATLRARSVPAHLRTARTSILFPVADMEALRIVARRMGSTPHGLSQAILVCDSERQIGATPAHKTRTTTTPPPVPEAPSAPPALPADVAAMMAALDALCWPGRAALEPCGNAELARALTARAKVRAGMVKLRSHRRRDETGVELLASALLPRADVAQLACMVTLPIADVARGVALRCLLNRDKAVPAALSPIPDMAELLREAGLLT